MFKSLKHRSQILGALLLLIGPNASDAQETPTPQKLERTRKFRVSEPKTAERMVAEGGKILVNYDAFQIIEVPAAAPNIATLATSAGVESSDEDSRILLNTGAIDTTVRPPAVARTSAVPAPGKRLHLVHFAGPVKPEWVEALRNTGVEVVTYLPNNAYLIYGEAGGIGAARAPRPDSVIAAYQDWEGPYLDTYKIDPAAKTTDAAGQQRVIGTPYFAIQLIADQAANAETVAVIETLATGPLLRAEAKLNYYDVVAPLPPERLAEIAARPDVISIQPYFVPEKFDERQNQIVAGNLSGNVPSAPGYLAWLANAGFSQNQFTASSFAVDVTDSGIDNGTGFPNHFGLYRGGARPGSSRVVYNRLEGSAHAGSSIKGVDGHGNLNGHIIGGYNNLIGFPHQDSSGYRYGLGVAPFVRLGSSVIFDPSAFTSPSYKDLQARAYRDGARVSSNSWGADTSGAYNIDSQSYDALVRDAQPADAAVPAAGNQEMVIVFANGNAGPAAQTVGSPGTGKNVISVGAAENVQAFGGSDGSGVADSGADNAGDIISFSSRGPCADGRKKPEIVAPGTHVSGGVWQTANPAATGTADPLFDGSGVSGGVSPSHFFPGTGATQQFYTASSGTSHSTPCVAGGAALVRQYFLNRNLTPPSPAMTKGYLVNSCRYLTGLSANDVLPSNSQGMGEMNLGMAFDGVPRLLRDQLGADKFTATGQSRVFNLAVVNTTKPLRVTLAWTDAPGATSGNAYKNDLNLTVVAGGNTYRGNVFGTASSVIGGVADIRNNVESVFLPAGVAGAVTVTVTAANINSDGVPGDANLLDQDFALIAYDALPAGTVAVVPNGATIATESFTPGNGLIDNGETISVNFALQNAGGAAVAGVVAALQNSGGVTSASAAQTYGTLAVSASATQPFAFTASGTPGQLITASFNLTSGATNLGTVTYSFRLAARATPAANGAVITAESFAPPNGYIDPSEAVTVNFSVSNTGDQPFGNLTATLLASGGVLSPSGAQSYGAIAPGGSATRAFSFTGSGALGSTITVTLQLQDGATSLGTVSYPFRLGPPPDYFTEIFDTTANDTDNQSWLFTPNGSLAFYRVLRMPATAFPTDPTGGVPLALSDDSFVQVTPTGGAQVRLYGASYSTFFVGSNGYVTFGSGSSSLGESLIAHFSLPRIAALFDDLNPGSAGTVSWKQLADRVAVTFQSVPEFGLTNANNFQIEMFFDGRIRITCLGIAAVDGLIGLSQGLGAPGEFIESDFSAYPSGALQISPGTGLTSSGPRGGPFTPSSQNFTLSNNSTTAFNWNATKTQPWLTLSASSGTLAPGGTANVTVSLNAAASTLLVGTYADTITFGDTTNNVSETRPVSLSIASPLNVAPITGLTASGPIGGPFTPALAVYTLTNSSTSSLEWNAVNIQPWLRLSAAGGSLAPGASTAVTVSLKRGAATLPPGAYTDAVTFTSTAGGPGQMRPVNLTVADPLAISPATVFAASGPSGGPFTPASQTYTLTNNSTAPLTWTAAKSQSWLSLSTSGGTLAAGTSSTCIATINPSAAPVALGAYPDTVAFTNTTSGNAQTRAVNLTVSPSAVDYFTELFDTTANDTDNQSWLFTPNGSTAFYRVARIPATAFPTDPTGGVPLALTDDSFLQVTPTGGAQVRLYGTSYSTFFVGSNGYITFGSGSTDLGESLASHFSFPRIAALFDDLNPGSAGTVSWKQLADRVAVTFQNVPEFGSANANSFQIEMFFDGRVRITCLGIAAVDGLIGLSRGLGLPAQFIESDFSAYPSQLLAPFEAWIASLGVSGAGFGKVDDFDGDGVCNLLEWAFGTDPMAPSIAPVAVQGANFTKGGPVSLAMSDGAVSGLRLAAFARRKDAASGALVYAVEFSGDLLHWMISTETPTVMASDDEIEIVTIPYPPRTDGQTSDFFRVRVTAP